MLKGKTAIVTGAGRGIGQHIAALFSAEGANVVVHYHTSREAAERLAASLPNPAIAVAADLTVLAEAEQLATEAIARFGQVDILVNCAASFAHGVKFEDDTWERYSGEWTGVVGATFHITKAIVPHMKSAGGGRIINFAATLLQRPADGYGAHSTAKGGVLALTRVLAHELGPHGITVNAVSPGMTLTEYSQSLPDNVKASVARQTPLRRLAEPDDVARVVLFLASDLAANVTGANIAPDGGLAVL